MRILLGAALVALGIALIALWLGRDRFIAARFGVASIVIGLAVLFTDRLINPALDNTPAAAPPPPGALRLLGRDTNLAVVQLFAAAYMVERAYWLDADHARLAAVAVVALAALLHTAKVRFVPLALAAVAAAYAVGVTYKMGNFAFRADMGLSHIGEPDLVVPLWPVFWVVAVAAAFPQLQLIRWGRLRMGVVRGDRMVRLFGSNVLLAFGSAIFIAAAAATVNIIVHLSFWVRMFTY